MTYCYVISYSDADTESFPIMVFCSEDIIECEQEVDRLNKDCATHPDREKYTGIYTYQQVNFHDKDRYHP
jgi:hypothetical protein